MYVIGPVETRWEQALARGDEGVAPVFLATTSIDYVGHAYFPPNCGEHRDGYTIECVVPDPYTTRGEARLLAEQVRETAGPTWPSSPALRTWPVHGC